MTAAQIACEITLLEQERDMREESARSETSERNRKPHARRIEEINTALAALNQKLAATKP